jgi:hypothetical protein
VTSPRRFGTQVALDLATRPTLLSVAVACSVLEGVDAVMKIKGSLSKAEWFKILEVSATEASKKVEEK